MTITIYKVGFYHPSNANWSYGVWLVSNEKETVLCKETFGGEYRMIEACEKMGHSVIQRHMSCSGLYKGREVTKMPDIEEYHKLYL